MKLSNSILILLVLLIPLKSFAQEYTQLEIKNKIGSYTRMKNAGAGLIGGGIPLTILGGILYPIGLKKC